MHFSRKKATVFAAIGFGLGLIGWGSQVAIGLGTPEFWATHPALHFIVLWGSIGVMIFGGLLLLIAIAAGLLLYVEHHSSNSMASRSGTDDDVHALVSHATQTWREELAALATEGVGLGNESTALKSVEDVPEWEGRCTRWRAVVVGKIRERDPVTAQRLVKLRPYAAMQMRDGYFSFAHGKTEEMVWEVVRLIDSYTSGTANNGPVLYVKPANGPIPTSTASWQGPPTVSAASARLGAHTVRVQVPSALSTTTSAITFAITEPQKKDGDDVSG